MIYKPPGPQNSEADPLIKLMCGINYLDMKEVAERLKMKSADAATKWCINHEVEMMTLGNKRVVLEFAFMLSFEKPLIDSLKREYGDNWAVYYEVYKSGDVKRYYELKMNIGVITQKPSAFNPDAFLNDIGYGKSKNS